MSIPELELIHTKKSRKFLEFLSNQLFEPVIAACSRRLGFPGQHFRDALAGIPNSEGTAFGKELTLV